MRALKYFKSAFLWRWNLLLLAGATGFGLISGHADALLPMVAGAELLFLTLLGTHPKYQNYVDAQEAKALRGDVPAEDSHVSLQRIMAALPADAVKRFEALRRRCLELRQIAMAIKDPAQLVQPVSLEQAQLSGLDRLLWIFVRLLYTEASLARFLNLERFLEKDGDARLRGEIEGIEKRLKQAEALKDELQKQRIVRTLTDSLETSRDRLANFQKARDNLEIVRLEIERLETKIRSLSELAVNRQEPDFVSGQVDQVATSMIQAEKTMSELQFATGLIQSDDSAPAMLNYPVAAKVTQ